MGRGGISRTLQKMVINLTCSRRSQKIGIKITCYSCILFQFSNYNITKCCKKCGGHLIENSPFLPQNTSRDEIEKYNFSFKNISYKKCCEKRRDISYRIHFLSLLSYYSRIDLPGNSFKKEGGVSYRIHSLR